MKGMGLGPHIDIKQKFQMMIQIIMLNLQLFDHKNSQFVEFNNQLLHLLQHV